jgi:polysaccharide export outer membrane protein
VVALPQQVGSDGAISVPYAGAAFQLPAVHRKMSRKRLRPRLAAKALQPQALVIIKKSDANAVTVTGEVVAGATIPLSPGGNRLLEVIAAAGGVTAPPHETFVPAFARRNHRDDTVWAARFEPGRGRLCATG